MKRIFPLLFVLFFSCSREPCALGDTCSLGSLLLYQPASNIVGMANGEYVVSTNMGQSWTRKTLLAGQAFNVMAHNDGVYLAADYLLGNQILASRDGGLTWSATTNSPFGSTAVKMIVQNGTFVMAGSGANQIAISTDRGTSWTQTTGPAAGLQTLGFAGGVIFGPTAGATGIFVSTDTGKTWNAATGLPANQYTPAAGTAALTGTIEDSTGNVYIYNFATKSFTANGSNIGNTLTNPAYLGYGNGVFLAAAISSGPVTLYVSTDLVTWKTVTPPASCLSIGDATFAAGYFLITCQMDVFISTDAVTWTGSSTGATVSLGGISAFQSFFSAR